MLSRASRLALTLTIVSPATTAANAQDAAEEGAGVPEIVVTAQRRSESIMKVPIAITALDSDALAARGIDQSGDLALAVPSLQINSAFGDAQPNFTLRGIGVANEYNPNQASPVGVYIDDAYMASRSTHGVQLYDLERVEILRGPQGTLYGRNTTGGAVNLISRKPSLSGSNGFVEFGVGSFGTVRAQAALEATPVEGKLGVRAAVDFVDGGGYVKNLIAGEPDLNSSNSISGRLIIRANPSDALNLMLKFTANHGKPTQQGIHDIGTGPDGLHIIQNFSRKAAGLGFWEAYHPRAGRNLTEGWGVQFVGDYDASDSVTLTSLTSYNEAKQRLSLESTGSIGTFVQLIDQIYGDDFVMFNQELRASYSSDKTNAQIGAYYGFDKDTTHSYYWLVEGAVLNDMGYVQRRRSYAVFGQIDQKLTPNLGVTMGLRYTADRSSYRDGYSYLAPISIFDGTRNTSLFDPAVGTYIRGSYDPVAGEIVPSAPLLQKDNALTARAVINYTTDAGTLFYASYSRGYRAGAFCGQCIITPDVDIAKPEKVDAYEVGMKGRFLDNRLRLSLSLFQMDYANQQVNFIVGVNTRLGNAPRSRIRGIEVETVIAASDDVQFNLDFSYLDARYRELTSSGIDLAGNYLPFAPKFQGNISADFTLLRPGGDHRVVFTPSAHYVSRSYFSPFNEENGYDINQQEGNIKVNAQIAYEMGDFALRGWVKNLFNEKTHSYGVNLTDGFGYHYMLPAPPRTYGVSARYRF